MFAAPTLLEMASLEELLRAHHVFVPGDDTFQRKARLLQALWRTERGLPMGAKASGEPLGSRLPPAFAKESLANFLTEGARRAVREEMKDELGSGKLIEEERLYANLLSSQPLCFNLFGDLSGDRVLATRVLRDVFPSRVAEVTAIRFEHSPGRGDARFTADHSAFDVFVEHTTPDGRRGFLGIEVKYHEGLDDAPSTHRARYDEIADGMGCFVPAQRAALCKKPIQQMWRDHLLAGAMMQHERGLAGCYVFLHPSGNTRCARAAALYAGCLSDKTTFEPLTLESFVNALEQNAPDAPWPSQVRERYLGWSKIDALVNRS